MRLAVGARLGPYEVLGLLGAGGMGEVYKARDTRLLRTVAVKVLASDGPQRGERFSREAHALSRLAHPHICSIYDVGEHDGASFLVMEYLDGQTLAERLDLGPVPLDTALRWAIEIANALAEAHRQGLIHRDLKPGNVMLTREGAKVLDFGLVKLMGAESEAEQTHTGDSQPLTGDGVVVGTAPYMSPEQIEGKPVDARTDLFALGSVIFEMVAGKRAFEGKSRAGVLAAVLTKEPPSLTALQPLASAALARVVAKCLAKDPEDRWQTARDLASELRWILEAGSEAGVPKSIADRRRARSLLWGALLGAVVAAAGTAAILALKTTRRSQPSFEQLTFRRGYLHSARFAPDGQTIVYSAAWDGELFEVFSTRRGSTESRALGFKPARVAAISGSGEMALLMGLGSSTLVRAPLAGGAPRELLEHIVAADWTPDGSTLAVVRRIRGAKQTKFAVEFPIGHGAFESDSIISNLRVSPKGDRVALGMGFSGQLAVSVLDRSGTNTPLSGGWARISGLAWSPDADEIWFTAARAGDRGGPQAVWAVSLLGQERLVTRAPVDYQMDDIFRDGSVLLGVNNSRAGLLCLPPGEAKERELGWLNYSLIERLSPDGQTLLFAAGETGRGPRSNASPSAYLRGIDGSPAVRLGDGEPMDLSPDDRCALVARADAKEWFLLPTRAGMPRKLPVGSITHLTAAAWLDQNRIVLSGREEGHGPRIYLQDLETGAIRPVAPEGVQAFQPGALTPDRRALLGFASGEDKWSLYPVDGGEPRPIASLGRDEEPVQWSADGRVLYFIDRGKSMRESTADVYRMDAATGRRELWKTLGPPDPAGVEWIDRVALTPDGRAYCYTYTQTLASLQVVEGLK